MAEFTDFTSFTPEENRLAFAIARRAAELLELEPLEVHMDLSCVSSKTPLRLKELLEADALSFIHDIAGIRHNLNRTTGQLDRGFTPRFAVQQ